MILKNRTSKGRFFPYKLEGIPRKVWIDAYSEFDLTTLSERFGDAKKLEDIAVENNKDFGINLDSHTYSLIDNMEREKEYLNVKISDILVFTGFIGETKIGESVIG